MNYNTNRTAPASRRRWSWSLALLVGLCGSSMLTAQGPVPTSPRIINGWKDRKTDPRRFGDRLPVVGNKNRRRSVPAKPTLLPQIATPTKGIATFEIMVQDPTPIPKPAEPIPSMPSIDPSPGAAVKGPSLYQPAPTPVPSVALPDTPVTSAPVVSERSCSTCSEGGCVGSCGLGYDCPIVTRGYSAFDRAPWTTVNGARHPKRKLRHKSLAPVPAPRGSFTLAIQRRQVEEAAAERFVFLRQEWVGNTAQLTPCGQAHLNQVLAAIAQCRFPVIVEVSDPCKCGKTALDEARRLRLMEALYSKGIVDADRRVLVGHPRGEELRYDEIPQAGVQSLNGGRGFGSGGGTGAGAFGIGNFAGVGFNILGN